MKRVTMNSINAYLDGALDEKKRRAFEDAIADDPEARALVALHRQHVEELHRQFDPVLDEPVLEAMLAILRRRKGRH